MKCPECKKELTKSTEKNLDLYECTECNIKYCDTSWGFLTLAQWQKLRGYK